MSLRPAVPVVSPFSLAPLVVAMATAVALPATAEEAVPAVGVTELQTVTIIADPNDPRSVSGSSHVVTEAQLEKFEYTDVHSMLRVVPGVYVKDEDGMGLFPNIGIRGAASGRSSKITILEDGLPAAMAPYASPASYVFPTAARMRGIEVLKGPETLRHGPFTVGGTINLLSTAIPSEASGRVDTEAGSFGTKKIHASVGTTEGQWGVLMETYQKASDGFADIDRSKDDAGQDLQEYVGKLRWSSAPDAAMPQQVELKLLTSSERVNFSYVGLTDADFDRNPNRRYGLTALDHIDRSREGGSLQHQIAFNDSNMLTTSLYRFESTRDFARLTQINGQDITAFVNAANTDAVRQSILAGTTNTTNIRHQFNDRIFTVEGIQTELMSSFATGDLRHELTAGVRVHEDEEDRFQPTDVYNQVNGSLVYQNTITPNASNNRIGKAEALSAWLLDQVSVGPWKVTAALRFEDIETEEQRYLDPQRTQKGGRVSNSLDKTTVGLGATYALGEQWTLLAGVHEGFAPPGSGATDGQLGEESLNYELGARFRSSTLAMDAIAFLSDYSNSLQNCSLANPCANGDVDGTQQSGEAEIMGLEFMIGTTLFSTETLSVPARLNWTWTQGEVTRDSDVAGGIERGDVIAYLPENVATASLGVESTKGWSANASVSFVDEQCVSASCDRDGVDDTYLRTQHYTVVDVAAAYQLTPAAEVYVKVENLLDEQKLVSRGSAGARANMPRYAGVGFRLTF
ncbi:MAG: TonB-dependent receptor family protein [Gammaproteobacteria bacterium]